MNKFFVTKEIAEKLRAKGYNVEELHYENSSLSIDEVYQTDNLRIYKFPRIDEVLAWLRDEKELFIEVSVNNHTGFDFYFTIYEKGEECWIVCGFNEEWYDTYEGAALAGIECVIDNLI